MTILKQKSYKFINDAQSKDNDTYSYYIENSIVQSVEQNML